MLTAYSYFKASEIVEWHQWHGASSEDFKGVIESLNIEKRRTFVFPFCFLGCDRKSYQSFEVCYRGWSWNDYHGLCITGGICKEISHEIKSELRLRQCGRVCGVTNLEVPSSTSRLCLLIANWFASLCF